MEACDRHSHDQGDGVVGVRLPVSLLPQDVLDPREGLAELLSLPEYIEDVKTGILPSSVRESEE